MAGGVRSRIGVLQERLAREGWSPIEAHALATTIVAAVEGALLLARVERDTAHPTSHRS